MKPRQIRWLVAAASGAALAWIAIRRRQEIMQALPTSVQDTIQERIVLPFSSLGAEQAAIGQETPSDAMTRKVGTNRRISVHGKLYGPLDSELVGLQVEVLERDGQLVVSHDGQEVGSFALES